MVGPRVGVARRVRGRMRETREDRDAAGLTDADVVADVGPPAAAHVVVAVGTEEPGFLCLRENASGNVAITRVVQDDAAHVLLVEPATRISGEAR